MRVVVVGNGIAGVTAALRLRARRPEARITLVSAESPLFFSRPALMYVYLGQLRFDDTVPHPARFFDEQRIERLQALVRRVDVRNQRLELEGAPALAYDQLLLATGARPRRLGCPGEELQGVQGFYDLEDLHRLELSSHRLRHAVVVGGGLIGVELAEMLRSRGVAVTCLVREEAFYRSVLPKEESRLVGLAVAAHGVVVRTGTELRAIEGDAAGRVAAVTTSTGERLECQLVAIAIGVQPNLGALGDAPLATGRGVLVDDSLRASVPGVLAAGDCAELTVNGERVVEQLWYTGKHQGEVAGDVLAGADTPDGPRRYERGVWFNSAKFFDLEWHTYGRVPAEPALHPALRYHFWRHPTAAAALRICTEGGVVVGMNALGLRQRHRVWERWLREQRTLSEVLARLPEAGFDPELSRRHEREIARALSEPSA